MSDSRIREGAIVFLQGTIYTSNNSWDDLKEIMKNSHSKTQSTEWIWDGESNPRKVASVLLLQLRIH